MTPKPPLLQELIDNLKALVQGEAFAQTIELDKRLQSVQEDLNRRGILGSPLGNQAVANVFIDATKITVDLVVGSFERAVAMSSVAALDPREVVDNVSGVFKDEADVLYHKLDALLIGGAGIFRPQFEHAIKQFGVGVEARVSAEIARAQAQPTPLHVKTLWNSSAGAAVKYVLSAAFGAVVALGVQHQIARESRAFDARHQIVESILPKLEACKAAVVALIGDFGMQASPKEWTLRLELTARQFGDAFKAFEFAEDLDRKRLVLSFGSATVKSFDSVVTALSSFHDGTAVARAPSAATGAGQSELDSLVALSGDASRLQGV